MNCLRFWRLAPFRAACALFAAVAADARAATFSVTSTADSGAGTLRQAILDANADATSPRTISFNIPGTGAQIITLAGALPEISRTMSVDGTTQPGYAGMPLIVLNGNSIDADGLVINSFFTGSGNGPVIKALCIINFGANGGTPRHGMVLRDGDIINVMGCFIGIDPGGTAAARNTGAGIRIENFPYRIGGTTPADRNVISGNLGAGIDVASFQATILGNYIGTSADGMNAVPNGGDGIVTDVGGNHTIGGTVAGAGNVISGNAGNGVHIKRFANLHGNIIGLGSDGAKPLGNTMHGVLLEGTSGRIGNATSDTRNFISANGGNGVRVAGTTTSNDFVFNNYIGTDVTGTLPRGNGSHGVEIVSGALRISSNVISANNGAGVRVASGNGNVSNNLIGVNATGTAALGNTGDGILIDNVTAGNLTTNTIGGNSGSGIRLIGANSHDIFLLGNRIGMSLTATSPLGNNGDGITITNGAQDEVIGSATGFVFGEANTIANNAGAGILYSARNKVLVNSIFNNGGLALDRGGNGVDPAGAGILLSPPTVTGAEIDINAATVNIDFFLDGAADTPYRLRFYTGDPSTRDPTGFGEIPNFVGTIDATTNGNGHAEGRATFQAGSGGSPEPRPGWFMAGVAQTNPTGTPSASDTTEVGPGAQVTGAAVVIKTETTANHPTSGDTGHPINTFSGELFDFEGTDLNLGGPLPLFFARYYASRLTADANISSALGRNRLHNFDAKLTVSGNDATAVLNDGRVITFTKVGAAWTLAGAGDVPFQLVQAGASMILGDPRTQLLRTFDASGRLSRIEDGRGNTLALVYNANSQLDSVTDGLGRALSLSYNGTGQLVRVADQTNRHVDFTYAGTNLATVADALGHTTTFTYDASGQLLSIARPLGNTPLSQTFDGTGRVATQTEHADTGAQTIALAYDNATHTTTITDPIGETRSDQHTASGELSMFTDEENKVIILGSDAAGRRSTITDRLGRMTAIAYDASSGKPASITSPDGTTTAFQYQARTLAGINFFDLTKITLPDGSSRFFAYDGNGNLLSAIDELGKTSTFTYNNRGQVLTAIDPAGRVVTFTYDAAGNLASRKDNDTAAVTFNYDVLGRIVKLTHPDGAHRDIVYDADDRIVAISDERGATFGFAYDANDNLVQVTDPANNITQFAHDALDRIRQITDRAGKISSRAFDSRDLLTTETDALSHMTTFEHDTRQRLTAVKEPGGTAVGFGYNDEGEIVSVTDPLGHTTTLTRNALGFVTGASGALGTTTAVQRDALQQVTKVTDAIGRESTVAYNARGEIVGAARAGAGAAQYTRDAAGKVTQIIDPNGKPWDFTYTPGGRVASTIDPLGRATGFAYDTRGQLTSLALPEGGTCTIARDSAGLPTRMTFSDGTDLAFAYDELRRVTNAADVAFTYDAEGRITNSLAAGMNASATYDDAGRLATVGYANGTVVVTYNYDLNDRLTSVTDSVSGASVAFGYDAAGRLINVARSNGVTTTLTYDAADRLTRIQDGVFIDLQYVLNAAGEVTATDFVAPIVPAVLADTKTLSFNAASEISTSGYAYDLRGRLTASPGHTFTWDAASRLRTIDGATLIYDGLSDVATRTSAAETTRFFHHHAIVRKPIIAERNEMTNAFTRFYVWMPNGTLLYAIDGATLAPTFYHYDRVGSTLALTSANGTVTDKYAYSPYGELLGREGTNTQPFTFVGAFGVRAEQGFYQMGARYYDPQAARFLSRDPGGPRLADVATLDPYQYALGNPLRYLDVEGNESTDSLYAYQRIRPPVEFGIFFLQAFGVLKTGEYGPELDLGLSDEVETAVTQPPLPATEVFHRSGAPTKADALATQGVASASTGRDARQDAHYQVVPIPRQFERSNDFQGAAILFFQEFLTEDQKNVDAIVQPELPRGEVFNIANRRGDGPASAARGVGVVGAAFDSPENLILSVGKKIAKAAKKIGKSLNDPALIKAIQKAHKKAEKEAAEAAKKAAKEAEKAKKEKALKDLGITPK